MFSGLFNFVIPQQSSVEHSIDYYPIKFVMPNYSELARRAQIEGTLICQININADGKTNVISTKGPELHKEEVQNALKHWIYPTGGERTVELRFIFHLISAEEKFIWRTKVILPYEFHIYTDKFEEFYVTPDSTK